MCNAKPMRVIETLYLVAPPSMECKVEELSEFFPVQISKNLYAKNSFLVSSTNDPYMSLEEVKSLQKSLGVKMEILEDAGHINSESGYGEWPWLLQKLK